MTDQNFSSGKQSNDDNAILVPSISVIVKLDDSTEDNVKLEDIGAPQSTSSNNSLVSTLFCAPPQVVTGSNGGSISRGTPGPPLGKSLLGADLFQQSATLAMPPPLSTTVRKAKNHVSPGMSMVKWMNLQENRIRPPTRRKITLSEIAKHNTESDCWMVIRNCVYDVTEYIPYHPGGVPELMKGAGKDATALFNEVHRWVNFDSILRSCLQGYLQVEVGESFEESDEDKSVVPAGEFPVTLPETKFSQTDTDLFLHVDTRYNEELSDDNWCVSVLNRERLLLKVILKPPELWTAHVKLFEILNDDSVLVNFQNSFKRAVITIKKPSIGPWKSLGSPLQDNNKIMDSRNCTPDDYSVGTIVEKEILTHNVILIGVQVISSSFVGVPVGFHLKLRLVDGNAPARKYTPIIKSITGDCCKNSATNTQQPVVAKSDVDNHGKMLYFIIKVYPDGQLTKEIGLLQVTSQLEVGGVAGRYDPSFFSECDTLALIAAGSGITPFIRIVDFLRKRSASYPVSRILLIFFNHSEKDIIWEDQWARLAEIWSVFHFFPVISTPEKTWTGLTGRVDNSRLFESILLQTCDKSPDLSKNEVDNSHFGKFKAMSCGSSGFNEAFVTMLKNQTVVHCSATEEDVFIF